MYTLQYDIRIGDYALGMLDRVEIKRSVELLSDTAVITLPAAQYGVALNVEDRLKRGDRVVICLGYEEEGLREEFCGWLRRIGTDGGSITLECEDDLWLTRRGLEDAVLERVGLGDLLRRVVKGCGLVCEVSCSYEWTYGRFVISDATGYDVLKKVQEECGADIYMKDGVLHVHPPGEVVGEERLYDFARNVEKENLVYRRAEDKKIKVTVKALLPDGTVKEVECGSTGGEKVEIRCATSDDASMRARGELEVRRRSFDGYEGSITGWLIPVCVPSDSVTIHDGDYEYKNGTYFVSSVTTVFSKDGGVRKIDLGFRLN